MRSCLLDSAQPLPEDRRRCRREPPTVVYRFENEQLDELVNRTAHAGALSALVEAAAGYRFYFAVYVREVNRFTPLYLAAIDPFRKVIVYPALLRSVSAQWNATFGPDGPRGHAGAEEGAVSHASRVYWDKLSPEQRSDEMKRRAKVRKRN
jgi:hypothetical protein